MSLRARRRGEKMRKTLKLLGKVGLGFGSTAGLFGLGILGCVVYGAIDKSF